MAEAAKPESGRQHESEGHSDPLGHIKDSVLFGLDARGQWCWRPVRHGVAVAGYEARRFGPVKVEFTQHMLNVLLVAAVLGAVTIAMARRIRAQVAAGRAPQGPLANAVEAALVFVRDELVEPVGGHALGHYTPVFVTYFLFILLTNLAGMIPLFGGATGNIAVTAALGGSVLLLLTGLGMMHQGPVQYLLHMVPPGTPWPMWPLLFFLEFIGPIIKCFVLCVRLFANMIAGHLVISNVLALGALGKGAMMPAGLAAVSLAVGVPLALGISLLEMLVCLIQAYVFTMLAIIFVGAAVHPQH